MSTIKLPTDSCQCLTLWIQVAWYPKTKHMNTVITPDILDIMQAVHYRPAVSLIIPFDTRLHDRVHLAQSLKFATDKVEAGLKQQYPTELVKPMLQKLQHVIAGIDFSTRKKSIAIFVSPVFEKILYLEIPVEEKIIIDESFEIRDLIYCRKQLQKYVVLLLSQKECKIFLGDYEGFVRIATHTPETVYAFINEVPERVANFSDVQERREVMMDKFLQHVDQSVGEVLQAYPLPLFVIGTEKITGHFRQISSHTRQVTEYVHGNYEKAGLPELKEILKPYIREWKKGIEKDLLRQLEAAAGEKKLVTGIMDVWREAVGKKGRLLVVEKNYMYPAVHGEKEELIEAATEPFNRYSLIRDAVDDIMEKVIGHGGDVEFVEEGVLKEHRKIALIKYY